jgi:RNA polymerase sigma factor (sigma-70 family)
VRHLIEEDHVIDKIHKILKLPARVRIDPNAQSLITLLICYAIAEHKVERSNGATMSTWVQVYVRESFWAYYKREMFKELPIVFDDEISPIPDDEEVNHAKLEAEQMFDFMERRLPPKRQEIMRLRYIEGLDNNEIAQRLNLSPETIRWHEKEALDVLRNRFARVREPEAGVRRGSRAAGK